MLKFILSLFAVLTFEKNAFSALEYSKIEHTGCPENAYCQKATGEVRRKWLDELDMFMKDKTSEKNFNTFLQKNYGLPVSGWAAEEAGVLPRIAMWDSPCKQHKLEASKFYISDFFRKNLRDSEIKEFNTLYFSRAIGMDKNKKPFSMVVPRSEIPTFIENGNYYFLREDDGKYYGLFINREGDLRATKILTIKEAVREAVCPKEQIDLFLREAPSPTFYQHYICKDIWDKTSKSYKTMLFGWSCN